MGSYVPSSEEERKSMLAAVGAETLDDLYESVPREVYLKEPVIPAGLSELEVLRDMSAMADEKVKTKLQKFIKNSSKTRDAFLENGFCGPEAQCFTGIVIDPVFDLLDRFRCDFPEVCSFREPTADHSIHIFV